MNKVLKLKQTQYACPSKWEAYIEGNKDPVVIRHRCVYPFDKDLWHVYILSYDGMFTDFEKETTISNDLEAIKEAFKDFLDFSETEIIPLPDPNEGYDWDEGWSN